jgi:hypothetical protein
MWLATALGTVLVGLVGLTRWFNTLQADQVACIPTIACLPSGAVGVAFAGAVAALAGFVGFAAWRAWAERPRSFEVRVDGVTLELGPTRIPLVTVRSVGSIGRRLLLDRDGDLEAHDLGDDDLAHRVAMAVSRRCRGIERVPDAEARRWMQALSSLQRPEGVTPSRR